MFKEVSYNYVFESWGGKGVYAREQVLLHEFTSSDKENMRIEYCTTKEATNATVSLKKYVRKSRMNLEVRQRDKFVFVLRREQDA